MKTIRDKMIKEQIRLDQCQKGDHIQGSISSLYGQSSVVIEKIKPIGKGKVQIKFKSQWCYATATIQKVDVSGALMVERTRKATKADGDAGFYPRKTSAIFVPLNETEAASRDDMKDIMTREQLDAYLNNKPKVEILDPLPETPPLPNGFSEVRPTGDRISAGINLNGAFGDAIGMALTRSGCFPRQIK
jgi:hypothetical protein